MREGWKWREAKIRSGKLVGRGPVSAKGSEDDGGGYTRCIMFFLQSFCWRVSIFSSPSSFLRSFNDGDVIN